MSEEDWDYLEALMESFGRFLRDIPYGQRDDAWWKKFHEFDDLIEEQIKKVQGSEEEAEPPSEGTAK